MLIETLLRIVDRQQESSGNVAAAETEKTFKARGRDSTLTIFVCQ